jgi:cell division protease FtsH
MEEKNNQQTNNQQPNNPPKNNRPKTRLSLYWLYGIILVVLMAIFWTNNNSDVKELGWTEFQQLARDDVFDKMEVLNKKNLLEATVKSNKRQVIFTENLDKIGPNPKVYVKIPSSDKFSEFYDKIRADNEISAHLTFKEGEDIFWNILLSAAPFALIIFVWLFFMRRMAGGGFGGGGGIFSVGKSKAQLFDKNTNNKTTFKEVAGLAEAKQEVEEIVK